MQTCEKFILLISIRVAQNMYFALAQHSPNTIELTTCRTYYTHVAPIILNHIDSPAKGGQIQLPSTSTNLKLAESAEEHEQVGWRCSCRPHISVGPIPHTPHTPYPISNLN